MRKRRSWLWVLAVLVIIGVAFFMLVLPSLNFPTADYDPLDPAIVQITQGTEGEIGALEIGLQFVDAQSAGAQLVNTEIGETITIALEIEEQTDVLGHSITLIDVLPGTDTAVFRIVQIE
ncbi:MAG: hypothetical protein AAF902_04385 [Chloroflexota bacterium]